MTTPPAKFKRAPEDHAWDMLNDVYKNCAAYSLIPGALTPFVRSKTIVEKVEDKHALEQHLAILARDHKEYVERLKELHSRHADRSGHSTDTTDMMRSIQLGEEYIEWCSSFESVILPTMETIRSMLAATGVQDITIDIPQRLTPYTPTEAS